MNQSEYEIPLSIRWLNSRAPFDQKARNKSVEEQFLKALNTKSVAMVADIGCGTGNNVLYLTDKIKNNLVFHLVERESLLLEESKKRIQNKFKDLEWINNNTARIKQEYRSIEYHFHCTTSDTFLGESSPPLDAVTASALFDLFTVKEFSSFFEMIRKSHIMLYSILNYESLSILPRMANDSLFISYFESHMGRELSKGHPMGKDTMKEINNIVSQHGLQLTHGESIWEVSGKDKGFLLQNFEFYEEGIRAVILNKDIPLFQNWIQERFGQIEQNALRLIVNHQDFLIKT